MEPYQILGMGTTAVSIILMIFTKSTLIFVVNNKTNVAPMPSSREETEDEDTRDEELSKEELLVRIDSIKAAKISQNLVVKELKKQLREYAEGEVMKTDRKLKIGTIKSKLLDTNTSIGTPQALKTEDNGEDPGAATGAGDGVDEATRTYIEKLVTENDVYKINNESLQAENEKLKTDEKVLETDNEVLKMDNEMLKSDVEVLKTDNEEKDRVIDALKSNAEASQTYIEVLQTETKEKDRVVERQKMDNKAITKESNTHDTATSLN